MGSFIDIAGKVVNNFKFVKYLGKELWLVKCLKCGNLLKRRKSVRFSKNGICRPCYILKRRRHGQSIIGNVTPEYDCWRGIKKRCCDPSSQMYKIYGAGGIRVCGRWMKFENFFKDMGKRPSSNHSIDRINNDGNYEPSNCRWATSSQQSSNRRTNRHVFIGGEKMILAEAELKVGYAKGSLSTILPKRKNGEMIVLIPTKRKFRKIIIIQLT